MRDHKNTNIYIIGAGISGLIAAINLEKFGYSPIILEASNKVGGRVKTDILEGYQLDRGFQVLLDEYPMAKKYLDYDALDFQRLDPGAMIYKNGKGTAFGDPLRDSSYLFPTAFSNNATLADKWRVYSLRNRILKTGLQEIFEKEDKPTLEYLKGLGFSSKIITSFFRPFFSGIFLETELATSSRMFEFVYRMFSDGNAAIPKSGIHAIPEQIVSNLKTTKLWLNSTVENVQNGDIKLANGQMLQSDFTIVATDPANVVENYASTLTWKSCDTLYFTTDHRSIHKPMIGLNGNDHGYINNIFYPTSISTTSKGLKELLSVTVVKEHQLAEDELIGKVQEELKANFAINDARILKVLKISNALPEVTNVMYGQEASESLLTEKIAVSGDHLLNGSLNAAMQSGEASAAMAHHICQTSI